MREDSVVIGIVIIDIITEKHLNGQCLFEIETDHLNSFEVLQFLEDMHSFLVKMHTPLVLFDDCID